MGQRRHMPWRNLATTGTHQEAMDAKIRRVHSAHPVVRIARLLVWVGLAAGCQREAGSTAPAVAETERSPELYTADIATLCDVLARSGADQLPPGERALMIATWLPAHLQTAEAHDYLVKIGPLQGESKA